VTSFLKDKGEGECLGLNQNNLTFFLKTKVMKKLYASTHMLAWAALVLLLLSTGQFLVQKGAS
jgi:hypothetical protein